MALRLEIISKIDFDFPKQVKKKRVSILDVLIVSEVIVDTAWVVSVLNGQ